MKTGFRIKRGATRLVFLTEHYAIKIPRFYSWSGFLRGLLANLQERLFSITKWPELCPVLFSDPFGLLVIMPRCQPIPSYLIQSCLDFIFNNPNIPVENKLDSFGLLDGSIVAIDYGS